jgi:small subunit ribosomal protein S20
VANSKSAAKRARQNEKRTILNTAVRSQVKSAIRSFQEALDTGDAEQTKTTLAAATRIIRKAKSRGVIHGSTASRRVSRLVLAFNKSK